MLEVDDDGENMGNEIGPGCYPLDFGDEDLGRSKLWIRKDYIRIHDCCEEFYNDITRLKSIAPSVIITGQPGIADSDDGFPSRLAQQHTKHFLLYTTSPHRERWKPLEKITHFAVLFMNPWMREEIFRAAPLHGFNDTHRTRINELYDHFGPTPRICFDFLLNEFQLISHEEGYQNTMHSLKAERLRRFISDSIVLNLDAASLSTFLLKRENVDDLARASVEPISTFVKSELQKRIRAEERGEQIRLYEYLAPVARSRHMAGLVFESLALSKFQTHVALELIPMVKWTSDESTNSSQGCKGKEYPQWHSNHEKKADNFPGGTQTMKRKLTVLWWPSNKADSSSQSDHLWIKICPKKMVEYQGSELKHIRPGIFYVPKLTNQVAFHSFIMADGHLYIFQFSIGSSHSLKPRIVPFFSQPSLPPKTKWRFVFVIPPGSEISCPQLRKPELNELLKEMKLFSAELDPGI
ncbi:hypothetical protein BJV78DRAFT_1151083 [Lactifluus subvellereus]|nr:hypothetical protein BJV78DRAFT_1151083 [Lactifluus subvellereus]